MPKSLWGIWKTYFQSNYYLWKEVFIFNVYQEWVIYNNPVKGLLQGLFNFLLWLIHLLLGVIVIFLWTALNILYVYDILLMTGIHITIIKKNNHFLNKTYIHQSFKSQFNCGWCYTRFPWNLSKGFSIILQVIYS